METWNFYVVNNSANRYELKLDTTFTRQTKNYFGVQDSTYTNEQTYTVRPGQFVRFIAEVANLGIGQRIINIPEMVVLSCATT